MVGVGGNKKSQHVRMVEWFGGSRFEGVGGVIVSVSVSVSVSVGVKALKGQAGHHVVHGGMSSGVSMFIVEVEVGCGRWLDVVVKRSRGVADREPREVLVVGLIVIISLHDIVVVIKLVFWF